MATRRFRRRFRRSPVKSRRVKKSKSRRRTTRNYKGGLWQWPGQSNPTYDSPNLPAVDATHPLGNRSYVQRMKDYVQSIGSRSINANAIKKSAIDSDKYGPLGIQNTNLEDQDLYQNQ